MIKENHEYLVDSTVLNKGESFHIYRAVLVNQRFQGEVFSFANSFSFSGYKNRLSMMEKKKSSSWKRVVALTVIPLIGVFVSIIATPNYLVNTTNSSDAIFVDTITLDVSERITNDDLFYLVVKRNPHGEIIGRDLVVETPFRKTINKLNERDEIVEKIRVGMNTGENEMPPTVGINTQDFKQVEQILENKKKTKLSLDADDFHQALEKVYREKISTLLETYRLEVLSCSFDPRRINRLKLLNGKEVDFNDIEISKMINSPHVHLQVKLLDSIEGKRLYGEKGKRGVTTYKAIELFPLSKHIKNTTYNYSANSKPKRTIIKSEPEYLKKNSSWNFNENRIEESLIILDGKEISYDDFKRLQNSSNSFYSSSIRSEEAIKIYGFKGRNGAAIYNTKKMID